MIIGLFLPGAQPLEINFGKAPIVNVEVNAAEIQC